MILRDYLSQRTFRLDQETFCGVDPATVFGHVSGPNGEPIRVEVRARIPVPVYDWASQGVDEDERIAAVLVEAAQANPIKVPNLTSIDNVFWASYRNVQAALVCPDYEALLYVPRGVTKLVFPYLPKDRVVLMGPAAEAGLFVEQGSKKGVLTHNKRGLMSVQFAVAS